MTPRHKRRTSLTPDEKAEVMASLAMGRSAAIFVSMNSKIGSPVYIAADTANRSILQLAKELTGDDDALLAPLHASPASPKLTSPDSDRS
jgi:hypothetical protein